MQNTDVTPRIAGAGGGWPRITVVTPSLNQGAYVEETIRSVLRQEYPNLEYIVIDGGSRDGSIEIIRKYEKQLAFWRSEPDRGQPDALNQGFAKATGEIFGFINSDDVLAPAILADVAREYLQAPAKSSFWISYAVDNMGIQGERWTWKPEGPFDLLEWLTGRASLHQPGVFWSAGAHRLAGGFDRDLHSAFDREFFVRLAAAGHRPILRPDRVAATFRFHAESKSTIDALKPESGRAFTRESLRIARRHSRDLDSAARIELSRHWAARRQETMARIWSQRRAGRRRTLRELANLVRAFPSAITSRFFWTLVRSAIVAA